MSSFPRLYELTAEEMFQQYKDGDIDIEFMCAYIEKIDNVYNKLIDYVEQLEKRTDKAIRVLEAFGGNQAVRTAVDILKGEDNE